MSVSVLAIQPPVQDSASAMRQPRAASAPSAARAKAARSASVGADAAFNTGYGARGAWRGAVPLAAAGLPGVALVGAALAGAGLAGADLAGAAALTSP